MGLEVRAVRQRRVVGTDLATEKSCAGIPLIFKFIGRIFFKSEVQERSRRIKKVVHDDNAAVIKGILLVDTLPST